MNDRRPTTDVAGADVEVLSETECLALLRSRDVGRIALVDHGQPLIFPVNYATDERAVVFHTAAGVKLAPARSRVAFEVDEVDAERGVAWSVLVTGNAYEITATIDHLSERLRELVVRSVAPGERRQWMAVRRHGISGRRFRLPRS